MTNGEQPPNPAQAGETAACAECLACDAVCPVASRMDVLPSGLVRIAKQGGAGEEPSSIWECLDCRRCTAACAPALDVHGMINGLRRERIAREPKPHPYARWHLSFVSVVEQTGRFLLGRLWWKFRPPPGTLGLALYRVFKGKAPLRLRKVPLPASNPAGRGDPR